MAGSPTRADYAQGLKQLIWFGALDEWAITADLSGYYTHVDLDELERLLLSVGGDDEVVRDLGDLPRGKPASRCRRG